MGCGPSASPRVSADARRHTRVLWDIENVRATSACLSPSDPSPATRPGRARRWLGLFCASAS
eukprot:scaffold189029_cov33-Tisochrysis_lutea.AAC.1